MNEEERYKLEKELWVSNLTGSTLEEIIFVVLIIPIAAYFHRNLSIIIQRKCTNIVKDKHKSTRNAVLWRLSSFAFFFLIDYVSIVLPMILCLTFTQYIWILHVILFGLDLCWKLFYTSDFQNKYDDQLQSLNSNKKLFLNVYRSSMMLLTCIAILAVDFRIFPRKFAKTETYGISLMDVGVGSFVISSALVSQKAREGLNQRNILNKSVSNNPTQILSKKHLLPNRVDLLISTLRSIALLLFLGVSRFIIVKTLNYQEHITEYGVHWNFFLTLALVTLFVAVLNISPLWSGTVGLLLLCVYQVLLSHFGVAEYIINAERTNFFNQNREGILSLIGYIALFLIGTQIGYYVMRPKTYRGWWLCVCELIFGAIVCWLLGHIFEDFFHLYSSRRMVNVSYVLHVLCVNLLILALCLVVDLISSTKEHYDNLLTRMTSQRNSQLVVFLLANILTGVVNLSMRTLYASTVVAFFVINCYMIVVCLIAYVDPLKVLSHFSFLFNKSK